MSQKSTKISRSQKVVKNLKAKIKELEKDRTYYKDKYYLQTGETEKKEEVIKSFENLRNVAVGGRTDALEQEVKHLQEIIKWLINPSTTTDAKRLKRAEDFPHPHF